MKTVMEVKGMKCGHCKASVEKACRVVAGVETAEADLKTGLVTVVGTASPEALKRAVADAGFEVV